MIRQAPRRLLQPSCIRQQLTSPCNRRFISTTPPASRRSWKGTAVRWGLAAGIVYYYNTSNLFADTPKFAPPPIPQDPTEETPLPTLESVAQSRSSRKPKASIYDTSEPSSTTAPTTTSSKTTSDTPAPETASNVSITETPLTIPPSSDSTSTTAPASDLDEESEPSSAGGAFNEETGEINWDCPCLGGMAYGPCGEEFRTSFSCFVFSDAEVKGMDCIEHFKAMQGCFREHPDVYGSELEEEEMIEDEEREEREVNVAAALERQTDGGAEAAVVGGAGKDVEPGVDVKPAMSLSVDGTGKSETPKAAKQVPKTKGKEEEVDPDPVRDIDEPVPVAAHSATGANK